MRIEPRTVTLNEAVALQPLQPLPNGGRRQADALRQFDIGNAPVRLQDFEDFPVDLICFAHLFGIFCYFPYFVS